MAGDERVLQWSRTFGPAHVTIRTCSVIGAGVAARAIAPAMMDAGILVRTIGSRSERRASALAGMVGARATRLTEVDLDVDLMWLCVTDSALSKVVHALAQQPLVPSSIFTHLAGALPASVLKPIAEAGARVGKAHPIASLAGGSRRLMGVVWGLEGEPSVLSELSELVHLLDGITLDLTGVDLELYHLAAVFAANLTLGVLSTASDLWQRSGASMPADDVLIPLVKTVLNNWEGNGLAGALTGPIVRGDVAAVDNAMRRLSREGSYLQDLYRMLGRATLELARQRAEVEPLAMAQIAQVLRGGRVLD